MGGHWHAALSSLSLQTSHEIMRDSPRRLQLDAHIHSRNALSSRRDAIGVLLAVQNALQKRHALGSGFSQLAEVFP